VTRESIREVRREIDQALFRGLRRLDAPETPGALDTHRVRVDVEIVGLEREGFARARASLGRVDRR